MNRGTMLIETAWCIAKIRTRQKAIWSNHCDYFATKGDLRFTRDP